MTNLFLILTTLLPLDNLARSRVPDSFFSSLFKDVLWMTEVSFFQSETPMWVGWNSFYSKDSEATEQVWYLPQINLSPTPCAVAKETLKRSQTMAIECKRKNICVTYDLAIAKMALEIQTKEAPTSDNVFVALGAFHIEIFWCHWEIHCRIRRSILAQ